jgi:ThiF family
MEVEHSRTLLLGGAASESSEQTLLARLEGSRVLVGADPGETHYLQTAGVLLDTLRRLPISLALDPAGLDDGEVEELRARIAAIDPKRGITIRAPEPGDLRVWVGGDGGDADLFGIPIRHGARIGTRAGDPVEVGASGLGIFTAATLLAGEVFKRVAVVVPARASFPEELSWCPVTLGSDPPSTPPIGEIELDFALVGQGAIGTAISRILALLEVRGAAAVVDPERFAPENLGTYSLGTAAESRTRPLKTVLAAEALPGITVSGYAMRAEEFINLVERGEAPWPRLVLSGLDSAEARREVQRLWPDRLIDGATGDTMCGMLDVRRRDGACLLCLFPKRSEGETASARLAAMTGLPERLLRAGDQLLSEADLASLDPRQRELLSSEVGKPVCGLAEAVGLTDLADEGYRPSVPFVSQQAACLVVGRLLADMLNLGQKPNFVQYDALAGPDRATVEERRPSAECTCQQRAAMIEAIREQRSTSG